MSFENSGTNQPATLAVGPCVGENGNSSSENNANINSESDNSSADQTSASSPSNAVAASSNSSDGGALNASMQQAHAAVSISQMLPTSQAPVVFVPIAPTAIESPAFNAPAAVQMTPKLDLVRQRQSTIINGSASSISASPSIPEQSESIGLSNLQTAATTTKAISGTSTPNVHSVPSSSQLLHNTSIATPTLSSEMLPTASLLSLTTEATTSTTSFDKTPTAVSVNQQQISPSISSSMGTPALAIHMPATNVNTAVISPMAIAQQNIDPSSMSTITAGPFIQTAADINMHINQLQQNLLIGTDPPASIHAQTIQTQQAQIPQNQLSADMLQSLAGQMMQSASLMNASVAAATASVVVSASNTNEASLPQNGEPMEGIINSNSNSNSNSNNGLGITTAPLQPEASSVSGSNSSTMISKQNQQQQNMDINLEIAKRQAHSHARSLSIADGMLAMYPNGSGNSGVGNGMILGQGGSIVSPQNAMIPGTADGGAIPDNAHLLSLITPAEQIAQLQQAQLQNHMIQQLKQQVNMNSTSIAENTQMVSFQPQTQPQQQHKHTMSMVTSTVASSNQSSAPSPFTTPSVNIGNIHSGHRRQLSSTFPTTFNSQLLTTTESQHNILNAATAPATLVPGTPTSLGQLSFQPQHQLIPHGNHHSHHGHIRHLSLDNAALRLLQNTDQTPLTGIPLHETIHENPNEASQVAQSLGQIMPLPVTHQQQLQFQLQQLQSNQAISHTVPVTPQQSVGLSTFSMFPLNTANIQINDQGVVQQQQQQQQQQQPGSLVISPAYTSPIPIDSASASAAAATPNLPSAFHPVTMVGNVGLQQVHISAQQHQQQLMDAISLAQQTAHPPMHSIPQINVPDAINLEEFDEEEEEEENVVKDHVVNTSENNNKASSKNESPAVSNTTSKSKKPKAPYKRFRNSFIFFANERRKQWRIDHPEESKIQNRDFIQEMSKVWNQMSDKEKVPYIKMADDDKLRYEADVKKYGPLPQNTSNSSHNSSSSGTVASAKSIALNIQGTAIAPAPAPSTLAIKSSAVAAKTANVRVPMHVSISSPPAITASTTALSAARSLATLDSPHADSIEMNTTVSAIQQNPIIQPYGIMTTVPVHTGPLPLPTLLPIGNPVNSQSGQILSATVTESGMTNNSAGVSNDNTTPLAAQAYKTLLQQSLTQGISPFDDSVNIQALGLVASAQHESEPNDTAKPNDVPSKTGTKRKNESDSIQAATGISSSIKRFRNSFIYFINEKRRELKFNEDGTPTNSEVQNREFIREMSAKWKVMSDEEKIPYIKMADDDKERFSREMKEYEELHPDKPVKIKNARRRRSSSTGLGNDQGIQPIAPAPEISTDSIATLAPGLNITLATAAGMALNTSGLNLSLTQACGSPDQIDPIWLELMSGTDSGALTDSSSQIVEGSVQNIDSSATGLLASSTFSTPLVTPLATPNVMLDKAIAESTLTTGTIGITAATAMPVNTNVMSAPTATAAQFVSGLPSVPEEVSTSVAEGEQLRPLDPIPLSASDKNSK